MGSFKILNLISSNVFKPSPFQSNVINKSNSDPLVPFRKRFVLLFYQHKEKLTNNNVSNIDKTMQKMDDFSQCSLISGFTTLEYLSCSLPTILQHKENGTTLETKTNSIKKTSNLSSLLFFDKLDSTGLPDLNVPKHSIRFLIQSFLLSIPYLLPSPCRFHLYAKSAPEYLFYHSKLNLNKHQIQGKAFLDWWKNTLTCFPSLCSSPTTLYFYSPGSPELSSTSLNLPEPWKYGLPWQQQDSLECIPIFPDDEFSRLITSQKELSTVHDLITLWDTLASPWTAYIAIDFHSNKSTQAASSSGHSTATKFTSLDSSIFLNPMEIDSEELNSFIEFVTTLDFGPKHGRSSCDQVLHYIKKNKWTFVNHNDTLLRKAYEDESKSPPIRSEKQPANDISSFVKKRKISITSSDVSKKHSRPDTSSTISL
ncbi:hypothetical protein HMI54_006663 [Coelomomyces lativittatus]|nr:hypothetical protein HMI56_005467 [Coelomomyces lativittatus]KAJ1517179.1 hypothetical protein HMI54_006663 [Coelomomyces lativittatus]KAJ1517963.1 hypothetical protein HMI55_004497 [Coelomomyces lativittatus]